MNISEIVKYNEQQIEHVRLFQQLVREFCNKLMEEAINHDQSKFSEIEYDTFVNSRTSLNQSQDGKDIQYQKFLQSPGIQHHILNNPHHPEHWDAKNEVMPFVQAILMFFDWKSRSVQRGTDFENFWPFNVEKLKDQEHAKHVVEAMKKALYSGAKKDE